MIEPKPLTCQCCGAPINRRTMRCDYCGTQYQREENNIVLNYVVEHPNTHKIMAKVVVPDEIIACHPESATEYSLRKMREQIADSLLSYMKISIEMDYMNRCQIIHGEIRVVDPTFTNY